MNPSSQSARKSRVSVLSPSVANVLSADLRARQPASSRPLYSLSSLLLEDWNYDLPTIASTITPQLQKNKMIKNLTKFQAAFQKSYGRYLSKLDYNNLLIAGGSISGLLLQENWNNDVDIFIYGLTEEQADQKLASILDQIIQSNREYAVKAFRLEHPSSEEIDDQDEVAAAIAKAEEGITITRTSNVVTFEGLTKIQIVLRLYQKKEDILYGFDLGSCAVGYDGKDVLFSGLGKYSYEHLVNIVDPSRRSTTYEHRLEKYLSRGFSIVLPELDISSLRTNYFKYRLPEVAELPYFPFSYTAIKGNKITLKDILHMTSGGCAVEKTKYTSDYDSVEGVDEYKIFYLNLRNLVRGDDNYYYYTEELSSSAIINAVPYISASRISNYYDSLSEKIFNGRSVDVQVFSEYFDTELLPSVVHSIMVEKDCEQLNSLIEEQKQLVLQRLEKVQQLDHEQINWNVTDPGTQLTGSFNPVISNSREWYGEYYIGQ